MRFITATSPRPSNDNADTQHGNEYLLPEHLITPAHECRLTMAGWDIRHEEY